MSLNPEYIKVADAILHPQGWKVASGKVIQTLWAGYGHICRLEAIPLDPTRHDEKHHSFILKSVAPPRFERTAQDEGHLRKLLSYQVEQYFYTHLASAMTSDIAVARCFGHNHERNRMAMILADLREEYPVAPGKRGELDEAQVHAALMWLAKFHGFWWMRKGQFESGRLRLPPLDESNRLSADSSAEPKDGVWLNGGYTYLATRRSEYNGLKSNMSSSWSSALCGPQRNADESIAELVAQVLSPAECPSTADYQTLIHGDVKSENLFSTSSHDEVAFFDFQYVGIGLGVCDLAKLFTCSVPVDLLSTEELGELADMGAGERQLLERYRCIMEETSGMSYPWTVLEMHWKTALVDWLRFQASWGFWGNTEWLEARVRCILKDEQWLAWVLDATQQRSSTI